MEKEAPVYGIRYTDRTIYRAIAKAFEFGPLLLAIEYRLRTIFNYVKNKRGLAKYRRRQPTCEKFPPGKL